MILKGNLHTHTNRTDGNSSPENTLELYRSHGYDFLALTDHYIWNPSDTYKGMTVISGVEYDSGRTVQEGIWHIVALGMKSDPGFTREPQKPDVRTVLEKINSMGATVDLAHPAWSLNRLDEILELGKIGIDCTEIYNSVSGVPFNNRPYSGHVVDMLAVQGCFLPVIGVDDTHFYTSDACRTYTIVDAEDKSEEAILKAIREGRAYASQGPEFTVEIGKTTVTVESTPVSRICFNSDTTYAWDRVTEGNGITKAVYEIKPNDTFVRVDMVDENGNCAWSRALPCRLG